MRAISRRFLLVLAFAALAPHARAQEALAFGEVTAGFGTDLKVRLRTSAGHRFTGRLAHADDTSMTVVDGRGLSLRLTREQIESLDVATPRSRGRGALRGAAKGAAAMAILGGFVYAVDRHTKREDGLCGDLDIGITECTKGSDVVLGMLGGAIVGAFIGGVHPGERWQAVAPGTVRLGLGPAPGGGVAVRASLFF